MVRWEPGTRERLQAAALELYLSRGFEETTVADIAQRVGLTERTFFRHFADKREVLFDGQDVLQRTVVEGVHTAPADASPLTVVAEALTAAGTFFSAERRSWSARRQAVITANPALQERELLKLAALASTIAEALRSRGVAEPAATLAAESGVTVFTVAFLLWITDDEERSFVQVQREVMAELTTMAARLAPTSSPQYVPVSQDAAPPVHQ